MGDSKAHNQNKRTKEVIYWVIILILIASFFVIMMTNNNLGSHRISLGRRLRSRMFIWNISCPILWKLKIINLEILRVTKLIERN